MYILLEFLKEAPICKIISQLSSLAVSEKIAMTHLPGWQPAAKRLRLTKVMTNVWELLMRKSRIPSLGFISFFQKGA